MSRASAQVKFPDGTIRYGIYNGTVDVYWQFLFETPEEAWKEWQKYYTDMGKYKPNVPIYDIADGPFYDVQISDDYGGGDTYLGRATKHQIVSATNIDHMNEIQKSRADWWVL